MYDCTNIISIAIPVYTNQVNSYKIIKYRYLLIEIVECKPHCKSKCVSREDFTLGINLALGL